MKIIQTRTIPFPASEIWSILDDFPNVQKFHPSVVSVDMLTEQERGIGARRQCNLANGTSLKEVIVDYVEGEMFSVDAYDLSAPVHSARGTLKCVPIDSGSCRAEMEFEMDPKYGVVGKLLLGIFARPQLNATIRDLLEGLEEFRRTGKEVTQK
mmetsp:Transcript_34119/g.83674  ORF Transcript_34119/g.83674 Transcript_34119/m.83674 type:complete len:154 (+) Transcript_34119:79-540(+)|eukprot:CAMPEP_0198317882 /NCGR_PEP_ID=MMETSP1450-20131203/7296_1 /TAXON_ID=753684 ORGANISM="Madagascaria erythrocladiodes, Strain CCMP3234" /NCGR_SAMPLE_ID=MMETSP1450 /ASSEMBLY_ACC=CAM_ASM_001115 /LENGTH=153 /DNA_ID=CAMNT_0044021135 /DNA_START=101 /DNA_END=562 /DNA_ORIENTATION=-